MEYECINRTILYGNVMNMPLIIIEINYSDIDSDDSSYYYWPVYMSRWCAHTSAVVFHTLHRGQRNTRLCTYLVKYSTLYPLLLPQLPSLLSHHLILPPPTFALPAYLLPPPLPPLPSPLPLTFQLWPVSTTTYPHVTPAYSPPLHIALESIALQYTVEPYHAFAECRST